METRQVWQLWGSRVPVQDDGLGFTGIKLSMGLQGVSKGMKKRLERRAEVAVGKKWVNLVPNQDTESQENRGGIEGGLQVGRLQQD